MTEEPAKRIVQAAADWASHPSPDIRHQMKSGFVAGAQGIPDDTQNYTESDLRIYRTAYAAGERWRQSQG